jgi:hypothetical protein
MPPSALRLDRVQAQRVKASAAQEGLQQIRVLLLGAQAATAGGDDDRRRRGA